MMMIADLTKTEVLFSELREELRKIGSSIGVDIRIQKEEIFDKMHRI